MNETDLFSLFVSDSENLPCSAASLARRDSRAATAADEVTGDGAAEEALAAAEEERHCRRRNETASAIDADDKVEERFVAAEDDEASAAGDDSARARLDRSEAALRMARGRIGRPVGSGSRRVRIGGSEFFSPTFFVKGQATTESFFLDSNQTVATFPLFTGV